jgi:hypothetical protein
MYGIPISISHEIGLIIGSHLLRKSPHILMLTEREEINQQVQELLDIVGLNIDSLCPC